MEGLILQKQCKDAFKRRGYEAVRLYVITVSWCTKPETKPAYP